MLNSDPCVNNLPISARWSPSESPAGLCQGWELAAKNTAWAFYEKNKTQNNRCENNIQTMW